MASVHYFQRYSQKENVATNNTLLLVSRLYHYSSLLFEKFICDLLEDTGIEPGISFTQQKKSPAHSVPDGVIRQSSFKIVIETKLSDQFSMGQLEQHLSDFGNEEVKILLLLGTGKPTKNFLTDLEQKTKDTPCKDVQFVPVTFADIINKFKANLPSHAIEMLEVIDDYEDFCREFNLLVARDSWMRVMACRASLKENEAFGIYYDSVERNYSMHQFVGFYANKSVRGIGKIENIIVADLNADGSLEIIEKSSEPTENQKNRIKGIIEAAKVNSRCYDIAKDHRFFCVDKFHKTDFRKTSPGGLMRSKFFDLLQELGVKELPPIEKVAEDLKNKTWE